MGCAGVTLITRFFRPRPSWSVSSNPITLDFFHLSQQSALADRVLGSLMLLVSGIVFTYYTTWTLILVWMFYPLPPHSDFQHLKPFFPQHHPLHGYFLAREWAIKIPAFILVVGLSAVGAFFGSVLRAERKKAERKRLAKAA
jgi:dolichol phosphate-mannose biosynthesis regulatory protein